MSWHVVATEFKQETTAHDQIKTGLGLETFLPRMRRTTRSHHRFADPYQLVMPGYVFVQWDHDADRFVWPAISRQRGVRTILGLSHDRRHVTPIRDPDFKRLQELAAEMMREPLTNGPPKPLPPDTVVRILWDMSPAVVGKVEFDNGFRADVLLHAAGVFEKINLPRELIEAVL